MKLARALASPEATIRAHTAREMHKYLKQSSRLDMFDLLKLWKALWYCLWLCDKAPTQLELSETLALGLVHYREPWQLLRAFFCTLLREWSNLDGLRVDKFYVLTRVMLRESFKLLHSKGWVQEECKLFLSVLSEEVFRKTPRGPGLHICDIYLNELLGVIGASGSVSVVAMLPAAQHFLVELASCRDGALFERLSKNFFLAALAAFPCSKSELNRYIVEYIQCEVFAVASDESTLEVARPKLYALHREFQRQSGKQNVEKEALLKPVFTEEVAKPKAVSRDEAVPSKKPKKSDKSAEAVSKAAPVSVAKSEFIASPKFTGSKHGYVFKVGEQGLGFYKDKGPVAPSAKSVTFGKNKSKAYNDSVSSLRQSRLDLSTVPSKGALKSGQSSKQGSGGIKRKRG